MTPPFSARVIPSDRQLVTISEQPWFRGDICIAEDVRRDYQILAQSMAGLKYGIAQACKQNVGLSSLHESATGKLRNKITNGTFQVHRLDRASAVEHIQSTRGQFKHRVTVGWNPRAFIFA